VFVPVVADPADPLAQPLQVHLGPTICFEDMFPYLHRRLSRRGVQLFVNVTNDAWYDPSLGARFHALHVPFRSAETRLPMVRATNTGETWITDGAGRIVDSLTRREKGVLAATVRVPVEPGVTLYARLGDWWGILAFLGSIALVAWIKPWRPRED
jgi:apolipoprotein N-acyltransferase